MCSLRVVWKNNLANLVAKFPNPMMRGMHQPTQNKKGFIKNRMPHFIYQNLNMPRHVLLKENEKIEYLLLSSLVRYAIKSKLHSLVDVVINIHYE